LTGRFCRMTFCAHSFRIRSKEKSSEKTQSRFGKTTLWGLTND
jgi:hypothetical protein